MPEEKEKTIYELELHERLSIDRGTEVLRVHGGWIYEHRHVMLDDRYVSNHVAATTFVPDASAEEASHD